MNNVKKYRKLRGLTQEELAEKTDLSTRSIAYYEAGRNPSLLVAKRLCKVLEVTLYQLFQEGEDERNS